jgi:hypothetical protein
MEGRLVIKHMKETSVGRLSGFLKILSSLGLNNICYKTHTDSLNLKKIKIKIQRDPGKASNRLRKMYSSIFHLVVVHITYRKGPRGSEALFHPSVPSSIHGWHHTGKKTLAEINNHPPPLCAWVAV